VDHATIIGTNYLGFLAIGAGMTNKVWIAPANVSFYRVTIVEVICPPTNLTGFYTHVKMESLQVGNAKLNPGNIYDDRVFGELTTSSPLYPGSYEYDVPVYWEITGSTKTYYIGLFPSYYWLLDSSGDFSVSKYGLTVTRSPDDAYH
jgi:hypothetical protein